MLLRSIISKQKQSEYQKIGIVIVSVPYRQPGNVIEHIPISFEVYQDGSLFKANAIVSEEKARLINLPAYIQFKVKGGKTYCKNAKYKFVAFDIFKELQRNHLIL